MREEKNKPLCCLWGRRREELGIEMKEAKCEGREKREKGCGSWKEMKRKGVSLSLSKL